MQIILSISSSEEILNTKKTMYLDYVDFIEFRAENLINDWKMIVREIGKIYKFKKKIILTLRSEKEGGNTYFSKEDFKRCIFNVFKFIRVDLLDVEIDMFDENEILNFLGEINFYEVIYSYHNFFRVLDFDEIEKFFEKSKNINPKILKIVDSNFNGDIRERLKRISEIERVKKMENQISFDFIYINMGENGKLSRRRTPEFDSQYSFVTLKSSDIGQFSLEFAKEIKEKIC